MSDQPPISKRAARRLIQQAFVLTARDRKVRQHIREARLETRWALGDWNFEWTVILDRGRIRFERRPSRSPDITLTWPEAASFFASIKEGRSPDGNMAIKGDGDFRNFIEPVYRSFCRSLEQVIKYPVDDAGNPLM